MNDLKEIDAFLGGLPQAYREMQTRSHRYMVVMIDGKDMLHGCLACAARGFVDLIESDPEFAACVEREMALRADAEEMHDVREC